MSQIAIIGSAWAGNKGAAAMLEAAITRLSARDPEVRFVQMSMYPDSDARLNPHDNVDVMDASPLRLGVLINGGALLWRMLPPARGLISRYVPEVHALADADVLLDQGGITFVDGREKYLIYNVASVLPALNVGTPVIKCAQALGPFQNRLNRTAARALLPKMATIVSRGAITHRHLTGLGLTNVHAGADLAFGLEIQPEHETQAATIAGDFFGSDEVVVGVSPSQVLRAAAEARGEDYIGDVAAQIDALTGSLGAKVYLVAHSTRARSDKLHNNDLPVCREILARVARPERVLFPDQEMSPQVLRALIGRCDAFVASRFHAMVSALAMGVPVLVLGWSHKYREVLDMFSLAEWALAAGEVTDDVFADRVRSLLGRRDELAEQIRTHLPAVQQQALDGLDVIEAYLSAARPSTTA